MSINSVTNLGIVLGGVFCRAAMSSAFTSGVKKGAISVAAKYGGMAASEKLDITADLDDPVSVTNHGLAFSILSHAAFVISVSRP